MFHAIPYLCSTAIAKHVPKITKYYHSAAFRIDILRMQHNRTTKKNAFMLFKEGRFREAIEQIDRFYEKHPEKKGKKEF